MVDICVDSSFSRDDQGVLTVRRCGDGATQSWPFNELDPATDNGLKRDETCGLWVAPAKEVLRVAFAHSNAPGATMWQATIAGQPLVANVVNPSSTLRMLLVMTFRFEWRIGQEDDVFSAALFGWTKNDPNIPLREVASGHRPDGTTSADPAAFIGTHTETITDVLSAGEAAVYRGLPAVRGFTPGRTTTYISSTENLDGFGISI